jgi:hypothetical protein
MGTPLVVKTKYLFLILLHYLRPSLVLDVGSLDGSDSLRFRGMLPDATIYAVEPNPYLYKAMVSDPRLSAARINAVNCAVSSQDGTARFYISKHSRAEAGSVCNRGNSSLFQPPQRHRWRRGNRSSNGQDQWISGTVRST